MRVLTASVIMSMSVVLSATAHADDDQPSKSRLFPDLYQAQTQAQMKPSLGIALGFVSPEGQLRNSAGFAVEYGYQKTIPFSVAVELGGMSSDSSSANPSLTRTKLLAKFNYNFGGTIPILSESYVGVGLGPVWDNVDHNTEVGLGLAPQAGFDLALFQDRSYTLGANASYLMVGNERPDMFALNGVAKYWF